MLKYFSGIEIEINHHCNLSCSYCPNSNTERVNKGLMTIEQFKIILNQLKDIEYSGRISYHFYNEPLLHPNLEHFVKLSKEILPKTFSEIFTNGTFLNLEKFKSLKNAGVNRFTVTHHRDIQSIIFEETFKQLSSDDKKYIQFNHHSNIVLTNRGGLVDFGAKFMEPSSRMCLIPSQLLIITVNGNVVTCYEDYNEKNTMGNIFQEHIKDIWEKPEYIRFRNDLRQGLRYKYDVCKTCNNLKVVQ